MSIDNLSYTQVIGRFIRAVLDTPSDPDTDPDYIPWVGLTITFTASMIPAIVRDFSSTPPATVVIDPIVCTTDSDGDLAKTQGKGVFLISSDDPDLTPSVWTYDVSITGTDFPGVKFSFTATSGATLDLTTVARVGGSSGSSLPDWTTTAAAAQASMIAAAASATAADASSVVAEGAALDASDSESSASDSAIAAGASASAAAGSAGAAGTSAGAANVSAAAALASQGAAATSATTATAAKDSVNGKIYVLGNISGVIDLSTYVNGGVFHGTLTGAITGFTLPAQPATNGTAWERIFELVLTQDATGSRVITWPAGIVSSDGVDPVLSTTPAAVDTVAIVQDGVRSKARFIERALA